MGLSSEGLCLLREGWRERWLSGLCGSPSRVNSFYPDRMGVASTGVREIPGPEGRGGPARLTRNQRTWGVIPVPKSPRDGESPPRWGSSPDGGCASQATLVAGQGEGRALGTLGRDPHRAGETVLERDSVFFTLPGKLKISKQVDFV